MPPKIRKTAISTAIACALLVPGLASAQRISSPYSFVDHRQDLAIVSGYVFGDQGVSGLGIEGGPTYGIQWAIRLSDPLQISAYGGYIDSERDVINPRAEGGAVTIGTWSQDLLLLSGRLHLNLTGARTWHNLTPYVFGGVGLAIDVTGEPGNCLTAIDDIRCNVAPQDRYNFSRAFLGQFGVGTVWLPTKRIGFRLSIHDNLWRISTPEGWFDSDLELEVVPPDADWTNNWQVTATLGFWY